MTSKDQICDYYASWLLMVDMCTLIWSAECLIPDLHKAERCETPEVSKFPKYERLITLTWINPGVKLNPFSKRDLCCKILLVLQSDSDQCESSSNWSYLILGLSVCRLGGCLVSTSDGDGLRGRGHSGRSGVSRLLLLLLQLRRLRRRRWRRRRLELLLLWQRRLWLLLILRLWLSVQLRLQLQLLHLVLLLLQLWRRWVFDYWELFFFLCLYFILLVILHRIHRWHQFGLFLCLKHSTETGRDENRTFQMRCAVFKSNITFIYKYAFSIKKRGRGKKR